MTFQFSFSTATVKYLLFEINMSQNDSVFHFTALSTSLFYKKAPSVVDKARNEEQKGLQKVKTLGK